jgi:hypothetical protein
MSPSTFDASMCSAHAAASPPTSRWAFAPSIPSSGSFSSGHNKMSNTVSQNSRFAKRTDNRKSARQIAAGMQAVGSEHRVAT